MAFWDTQQYRADAPLERDFLWQDHENAAADDSTDFLGQFIDLDGTGAFAPTSTTNASADVLAGDYEAPRMPEGLMSSAPPESIGSSTTADEVDFLSNSSHLGPASSASYDIDPAQLSAGYDQTSFMLEPPQWANTGRGSLSDTELPRMEGMTLSSPTKLKYTSMSHPSSPTPPNTVVRKTTSHKIKEAFHSTIRKATGKNRPKPRKPEPIDRPGSPVGEPQPLRAPRQRPRAMAKVRQRQQSYTSDAGQQQTAASWNFVQGACDDPFNDIPPLPPANALQYFNQGTMSPGHQSPDIKSEHSSQYSENVQSYQVPPDMTWQQQQQGHQQSQRQAMSNVPQQQVEWNGSNMMSGDASWWAANGANDNGQFADQKNAHVNMAMHAHQTQLPYEYHNQIPDTATSGLMIQIPQAQQHHHQQHQAAVGSALTLDAQTTLPPPPPIPATERPHRPPRAPSSGARHLSCSPVRKSRAPSASPTRGTPSSTQKRHSSGGSVASNRSASGRLPASMPGTPCSVKKRRSRDVSGGGGGMSGASAGEIGFVNFTPNDGGMLMGGVAPSGSSKTKARREKEALDRRRKLSEAAIKAVAAAGGDVDRLIEQGFFS